MPPPAAEEVGDIPLSRADQPVQSAPLVFDESNPPSFKQIVENAEQNAANGNADDQLAQYGHRWFYGGGFGRTLANVGTVVVFPPWALYLLGNAGLALAGYEPIHVTSALPDTARGYVLEVYDGVTSVPGRITSAIAGEKFEEK